MLRYVSEKFVALKLNTNAWFLDEKTCHAILDAEVSTVVFSADAATEPTYSQLRVNGSLEKVYDNIKLFQEIREKRGLAYTVFSTAQSFSDANGIFLAAG